MFIKIAKDGNHTYPYFPAMLQREYPNTSFPRAFGSDVLAAYGVFKVFDTPKPKTGPLERAVETTPAQDAEGNWVRTWSIVQLTPDERAVRRQEYAARIRERRDQLLRESDWTQVLDTKVDVAAWAAYRQQLRDVPSLPGFPLNIEWPTPPE